MVWVCGGLGEELDGVYMERWKRGGVCSVRRGTRLACVEIISLTPCLLFASSPTSSAFDLSFGESPWGRVRSRRFASCWSPEGAGRRPSDEELIQLCRLRSRPNVLGRKERRRRSEGMSEFD